MKKTNIADYILGGIFFLYIAIFVYINISPAKIGMSSDTANIGIVSKIFWENGSIAPSNFISYTESGVFSLSTIGMWVYGFTKNIWYAQCIPLVVIMPLLLWSMFYMIKADPDINRTESLFLGCMVLALLPGWYQQYVTFLSLAAYSLCLLNMFWLMGDFFRLLSGKLRHKWLHLGIQICMAFLQGLEGSRGVLMIYTPFGLLILYRYFVGMLQKKKLWLKEELIYLVCAGILWSASYFATYLPWSVRTHLQISRHGIWERFSQWVLPAICNELGFNSGTNLLLAIIIAIFLIIAVIALIWILLKYRLEDPIENGILFFTISVALTTFMCSVQVTGEVSQRYFILLFYFIALGTIYFVRLVKKKVVWWGMTACLILHAIVNLFVTYIPLVEQGLDFSREGEQYEIIDWMVERGYYYGYADYPDANNMTILAEEAVRIASVTPQNMQMCRFVTDTRWYMPTMTEDMDTVYILRKSNMEQIDPDILREMEAEILECFETENYFVYVLGKNFSSVQ